MYKLRSTSRPTSRCPQEFKTLECTTDNSGVLDGRPIVASKGSQNQLFCHYRFSCSLYQRSWLIVSRLDDLFGNLVVATSHNNSDSPARSLYSKLRGRSGYGRRLVSGLNAMPMPHRRQESLGGNSGRPHGECGPKENYPSPSEEIWSRGNRLRVFVRKHNKALQLPALG